MLRAALSLFTGGSTLIPKLVGIVTILSTLAGGVAWLYSSIKAQGAAEEQAARWESDYAALSASTGAAIAELNAIHARQNSAAAQRRREGERRQAESAATLEQMRKELNEARKTDGCVDRVLPADLADRVRQIASGAGSSPAD